MTVTPVLGITLATEYRTLLSFVSTDTPTDPVSRDSCGVVLTCSWDVGVVKKMLLINRNS